MHIYPTKRIVNPNAKLFSHGENMPFTIIVDGPNFINDLHRHSKDKDYIMNTLSFPILQGLIQQRLRKEGLHSHPFLHTEFICSNKPQIGNFSGDERSKLLHKLGRQKGVSIREIPLSSEEGQEKGVDIFVFARMLEMGKRSYDIVLIARDKDYVPALEELTKRCVHTIVVGFDDGQYPEELINESYLFIDMNNLLGKMEEQIRLQIERETQI